ncbi:hypothetical protein GCM10025857_14090 [Alicyclobacillus contaminans]|nr:hypothetical protein GCM10025857_14090 [Alicyclobacillus contaminans]
MTLQYDDLQYPFASRRTTVYAQRGMVATSQPLAAQAGLAVLRQGGNAVDAAIATAAALTVVEPTSNGIGGDAFALVWFGGELHGLNASGPAPQALTLDEMRRRGHRAMPRFGLEPITVPGAPAAWAALARRFGRLPLTTVLAPAIAYAEEGFPLTPVLAKNWANAIRVYTRALAGDLFRPWFRTFAPEGFQPKPGAVWKSPNHARTLRAIAESAAESFYRGELADAIDAFVRAHGGYLRKSDLSAFEPEWVRPLSVKYRGYDVWELPPNGQGLVALEALNILSGFDFPAYEHPDRYHRQIEAMKLAFEDGRKTITDPRFLQTDIHTLLSPEYGAKRRADIGATARCPHPDGSHQGGRSIWRRRTARAIWFRSSRATIWDLDLAS